MATMSNAEPRSATVIARPAAPIATVPAGFSRATLTGALAAPVSTQDHAQARSLLVLAQNQQRPGQAMRPIPVPLNRGGSTGYTGGYVVQQPGYVVQQPGYYQQPSSGFSFGLSTGPNGTSVWAGSNPTGIYAQQQTFAQDVIVANAMGQQYYLKAGYPMPAGYYVVNTNPGFWAWLTTQSLY